MNGVIVPTAGEGERGYRLKRRFDKGDVECVWSQAARRLGDMPSEDRERRLLLHRMRGNEKRSGPRVGVSDACGSSAGSGVTAVVKERTMRAGHVRPTQYAMPTAGPKCTK